MKSAIFLSARDKAKRLPKKLFLEIKGKPIIEHLIDRLKTAELPESIVLCTSIHPDDLTLVEVAKRNNIEYFQGSEDDKLDRYLNAALKFNVDFMVIVDGDDIFCDPKYIDKIIENYKKTNADFIAVKGLPLGATSTGLKLDALKKVCEIKDEKDTEVWGGYFTETGLFYVEYIDADNEVKRPEIRMTLDYLEDFKFFEVVFNRLYKQGKIFTLKDIVRLIDEHPEIADINKAMNERYIENLKKHIKVKIKDGENKARLWENWGSDYGELMKKRALGEEPEMEQVKQLIKLVKKVYEPGMKILDIGCGVGHFYTSLKKIDRDIDYHGIDIVDEYITLANDLFSNEKNAKFEKGDIFNLNLDNGKYDIVICYMVLPFIEDYKVPVSEIMRVGKKHIFIRLLLGDFTHIIKVFTKPDNKERFNYYNIYSQKEFIDYIGSICPNVNVRVYDDECKINIEKKKGFEHSTYTCGGLQIIGNIVLTWKVVHVIKN